MSKWILCLGVGAYLILAAIGCAPMACGAHALLETVGVDCQLVCLDIKDVEGVNHLVVQVDGNLYEPRYLGLYKPSNINYTHPIWVWDSYDEYKEDNTVFPSFKDLIVFSQELI